MGGVRQGNGVTVVPTNQLQTWAQHLFLGSGKQKIFGKDHPNKIKNRSKINAAVRVLIHKSVNYALALGAYFFLSLCNLLRIYEITSA